MQVFDHLKTFPRKRIRLKAMSRFAVISVIYILELSFWCCFVSLKIFGKSLMSYYCKLFGMKKALSVNAGLSSCTELWIDADAGSSCNILSPNSIELDISKYQGPQFTCISFSILYQFQLIPIRWLNAPPFVLTFVLLSDCNSKY